MTSTPSDSAPNAWEVARVFGRLGVSSFGGPIAHIGHFRREFVERRRWLSDESFGELVALTQFLPGPASSQLGFAIGLRRAGWLGAIAAFITFTLPSAALLFALASLPFAVMGSSWSAAIVHGLQLVAVAAVAHGVARMAQRLTPDLPRRAIALVSLAALLVVTAPWSQLAVLTVSAIVGALLLRVEPPVVSAANAPMRPRGALLAGALFLLLLLLALLWPSRAPVLGGIFTAFYQAGALVFGGGHVVLPLLEHSVVESGWVSAESFVAGYGAAQAVPGPLFTFAAYLGAKVPIGGPPISGAAVALLGIFLPGLLILVAVLPVWSRLTARTARAVAGVNAAVVGLLAAALYDPVWRTAVRTPGDAVVAAIGVALLWSPRRSPLWAIAWCVVAGALLQR